jgi:hypothetical protein
MKAENDAVVVPLLLGDLAAKQATKLPEESLFLWRLRLDVNKLFLLDIK